MSQSLRYISRPLVSNHLTTDTQAGFKSLLEHASKLTLVWQRIIAAIEDLQHTEPEPGETTH